VPEQRLEPPKVSTKEAYYFADENATYKISALDLGIKRRSLEI
jgi:carbamoyl-phosphate synthase small subunit